MDFTEPMIDRIAGDPALTIQFVAACKPRFCDDSAEFLLAAAKYKRAPTTEQLLTIYNLHIKEGAPDQVNLPRHMSIEIENYVKSRKLQMLPTSQAFSTYQRPMPKRPSLFNNSFNEVLNRVLNDNVRNDKGMEAFAKRVGLI